ncbi:MAG: ATP-binding cassette domain-containing protein [Planctomycetaceae bacterium]|nr:ATP-binding cassette domain-containing protein [Planctomycetota bacterium]NUN51515.1 ATP-binding cassette domain-containing protein [Planctomycetaceae bacterium]
MSGNATGTGPLLEVEGLHVHFPVHGGILRHVVGWVKAVDGVSFAVRPGETLGLVGESGSGKTTVGRAIINLLRPTVPGVRLSGAIRFASEGGVVDVNGLDRAAMHPVRAEISMVFQDPYSSLNPRMTVEQIVGGPLRIHARLTKAEIRERVLALLDRVGLQPQYASRYPHEFSGGQRQRIGIARALATRPKLVVADEPVSALDVSVRSQVINLMQELQEEFGLTYLFVAHDLSVVHHISDRIAVMYLGSLCEIGTAAQVYGDPVHPYAKALLSAVPQPDPHRRRSDRIRLQGDIPTPLRKPSGCGFRTRCPLAKPSCAEKVPELRDVGGGRLVACPEV